MTNIERYVNFPILLLFILLLKVSSFARIVVGRYITMNKQFFSSKIPYIILLGYAAALPYIQLHIFEDLREFTGLFLLVAASLLGLKIALLASSYITLLLLFFNYFNGLGIGVERISVSIAAYFTIAIGIGLVVDNLEKNRNLLEEDIAQRKKVEEKLKESEQYLTDLIDFLPDATYAIDTEGKVISWNKAMEDFTGISGREMIGKDNYEYALPFYNQRREMLANLALKPRNQLYNEHPNIKIDGDNSIYVDHFCPTVGTKGSHVWSKASPIYNTNGEVVGAMESLRDITERKEFEEKLKYHSFHDTLTGLYNRAFFEEELKRLDTERQLPLSIIIGDVNNLKLANDTLGHQEGDQLLTQAAEVLKQSCRKEDIVCRWGGDEFTILLPGTDEEKTQKICNRIEETCSQCSSSPFPLSISLGTATKKSQEENNKDLIKKAEDRMYRNKLVKNKHARGAVVQSMQQLLEEKTQETIEHAIRLTAYALQIGEALELSREEMEELRLLAAMHDIGKIAIPDRIIMKLDSLNQDEWKIMKQHTEIGYKIACSSPQMACIADKILHHHEWWDGSGYPHGLKGEEIPLLSRIIAIVDAFDVMTSGRPYKKILSQDEALAELKKYSGRHFDPDLVVVFLSIAPYKQQIPEEIKYRVSNL